MCKLRFNTSEHCVTSLIRVVETENRVKALLQNFTIFDVTW